MEKPIVVKANGQVVDFTDETGFPINDHGVTSIPIKVVGKALGFKVGLRNDNHELGIGKAYFNTDPVQVYEHTFYPHGDYQVINGRTYVTLDKLKEVDFLNVIQDSEGVSITSP